MVFEYVYDYMHLSRKKKQFLLTLLLVCLYNEVKNVTQGIQQQYQGTTQFDEATARHTHARRLTFMTNLLLRPSTNR